MQNAAQLKAVVRAILLDSEERGGINTDLNYGKLREPVRLATNLMRHFGVQSAEGAAESVNFPVNDLGFMQPAENI